jgi:Anti-sigma-K factor rskA
MSAPPVDRCGEAAVYALSSLESDEARAFERHLEDCVICRDELASFEEVTRVLPMAGPQYAPPPRLRRRVLAAVRASPAPAAGPAVRRRLRWSLPRPAVALGAAVALGCGVTAVGLALSAGPIHARVLDAQVLGAPGTARLRLADDHAELILRGMPQPPAGRIYEVWLQRRPGGAPQPTTALFSVTAGGDGDVDVPGSLRGVRRILVTREPVGGSRTPTTSPIVVAALT